MVTDRVALYMDDVASRAVAALAEADRAVGRVVPIAPGTAPAWDGDCNGYLYGRIVSIAPGQSTGSTPVNVRCGVHFWVATLAVAVIRCVGVLADNGKPPLPERVDYDGRGFSLDAAVLEQVLLCSEWTRSIVQGVPLEEQGGYSGFEWTYTVRYDVCGCAG
jgi:hypothetical protein